MYVCLFVSCPLDHLGANRQVSVHANSSRLGQNTAPKRKTTPYESTTRICFTRGEKVAGLLKHADMTGSQGAVNRAIKQKMVLILHVLTCTLDKACLSYQGEQLPSQRPVSTRRPFLNLLNSLLFEKHFTSERCCAYTYSGCKVLNNCGMPAYAPCHYKYSYLRSTYR